MVDISPLQSQKKYTSHMHVVLQGETDTPGSNTSPDVRRGGKAPASVPGNGAGPRSSQQNGSESPKPFRK